MIRQWFVIGVMLVITTGAFVNFANKALLYNPLARIEQTEMASNDKAITQQEYKAAWGLEILQNNLFSKARGGSIETPVTPNTDAPDRQDMQEQLDEKPQLSLSGIIVNQYGEFVAYIKKQNDAAVPYMIGDVIDEVIIENINDRSVQFIWYGEKFELSLSKIETLTR